MKSLLFVLFTATFFLFGCQQSSNEKINQAQEQIMQEANRQVGMPGIVNFQERKLFKEILELRDQENLICYAYTFSEMTGKRIFLGKCLGYGLPYATQYTNPEARVGLTEIVLPQADPNGLFMPGSADATWLMLLDKAGVPHPVYIEPKIIVSPFPLED